MKSEGIESLFQASMTYNVVRSRQLEGTYPGSPETACWLITPMRVRRGWGQIPIESWPDRALESWPPPEPAGLDETAKSNRIFRYQRVHSSQECLDAVRRRLPVMASFEITNQWFNAPDGMIEMPDEKSHQIVGSHSVNVIAADQRVAVLPGFETVHLIFENWWGQNWGSSGQGFMSPEFFDRWLTEAWVCDLDNPQSNGVGAKSTLGDVRRWILPGLLGGPSYIAEIVHADSDDRIAWCFVSRMRDCLEVEEFFVMPKWRRQGYGGKLLASLVELSASQRLPLKFVVPFADAESENLAVFGKMIGKVGYRLDASGVRWSPYFGNFAPSNGSVYFPARPQLSNPDTKSSVGGHRNGTAFDPAFEQATANVFRRHKEVLRRLA